MAMAFLYNPPRIFEAFWKIVKYFLNTKTFRKVKFVYPKNKDSVELMSSYFKEENLPTEFGGKAILEYNHEDFSKQMVQVDTKSVTLLCGDLMISTNLYAMRNPDPRLNPSLSALHRQLVDKLEPLET
ncbi:hypothetical protein V6N13_001351 [Hibiscus sabdariffa]|uniref:CRAL-TRIO domain-containing protein n=1 Tax=Hibiscus sabdariffa TaxID=183260 RepID=A0ABR2G899_9ROSI